MNEIVIDIEFDSLNEGFVLGGALNFYFLPDWYTGIAGGRVNLYDGGIIKRGLFLPKLAACY